MDRSRDLFERAKRLDEASFRKFWTLVVESVSILKEIAPARRKPWLQHVIDDLYDEQHGMCRLCGEPMRKGTYHVDHKIPFTYGGGSERRNLQLAHPACNREKGTAVDPVDLLRYLEDRYMNL